MELLGYTITTGYPTISLNDKIVVNTINPHSYCVSKKDLLFKSALKESDYLLPDGVGIVWAGKILKGQKFNRISGYDIFMSMMRQLNDSHGSCFFLGASQNTLDLIKQKAPIDFPNVRVAAFSPPYKDKFSNEDCQKMIQEVNDFKPNILFVGMTAPKQEKWVHQNKGQLQANVICCIGAVFDFYAGTVKRPSEFWINLGLEWFIRLLGEPRRLAYRNFISTPKFVYEVICHRAFK